jgi:hypothetical protein
MVRLYSLVCRILRFFAELKLTMHGVYELLVGNQASDVGADYTH